MNKETSKKVLEAAKSSDEEARKHAFYEKLYEKVTNKIEEKKRVIAKNLFK